MIGTPLDKKCKCLTIYMFILIQIFKELIVFFFLIYFLCFYFSVIYCIFFFFLSFFVEFVSFTSFWQLVYSCNLLKLVICVIFFIYLASKLKKIKNLINSMRYFFYQCSFFTQYLLNYDEHNSLTCEVFSLRFAWDLHGRDRMVVGFTTICAISDYDH